MIWVLIFSMYSAPFADNDFAALASQEFSSQAKCERAKSEFEAQFQTAKSVSNVAVCVEK